MTGRLRRLLVPVALLAALAVLSPATAAATSTPAPGYEQFKGCPHPGQNPSIVTCFRQVTTEGELQMGNVQIPISNPVTLSGGLTKAGNFDFNSFGGLFKVPHTVPGGVVGFTGLTWLLEYFSTEALSLYAVIELVGIPNELLGEPISLPIKVHMINQVLGKNCYIGSNLEPIELELATDTSGNYVDNSFAVPGTNGCFLTLFEPPPENIDHEINTESALPSASGLNSTTWVNDTETAAAGLVYP